ncbi:MAG TPA: NAD-dependent epimerase/dehydratase family protein [Candidatus Saccharimonadales bacterium]
MHKVLVTGANGFVGQHLINELQRNNIAVMGVGGPTTPNRNDQLTDYQMLDLTKPEEAAKIDFSEVEGVIHLAGLAAVGPSFNEPVRYISTNVGIETNLFEAARAQNKQPRFLIISTGALYDPTASLPLSETSRVLASSPYAVSKLGQEEMAQYYTQRGFECVIARPFNHIGPGQGPGFIVPDLAQQVVSQHEILVGNLDSRRDYTDVRDIVRAYRLLLEKGRSGEIYNICSGTAHSGHEILDGLVSATDKSPIIKQDSDKMRPSDIPELRGSHDKLTADTGWQPEISIETTLKDVIAEWQAKSSN